MDPFIFVEIAWITAAIFFLVGVAFSGDRNPRSKPAYLIALSFVMLGLGLLLEIHWDSVKKSHIHNCVDTSTYDV